MSDRPTLKSLAENIEELAQRVDKFRVPEVDAEARVIDKCARALAELPAAPDRGGYQYTASGDRPRLGVERVLDYLRQRHGLADPTVAVDALRMRLAEAEQERDELANRLSSVLSAANLGRG